MASDVLGRAHVLDEFDRRGKGTLIRAAMEQRVAREDALDRNAERFHIADGVPVISPTEAMAYLRDRVPIPSETLERLMQSARARAQAALNPLIQDLPQELERRLAVALADGGTVKAFVRDLGSHLSDLGLTVDNPYRLETIFRNNTHTAYNAARVQMYQHPVAKQAFGMWQYVTVGDSAVRPSHAAMDGKVFPADHPIWQTWTPPAGHGCRCTIVVLDEDDLKREGLRVSGDVPTINGVPVTPDAGFESQAAALVDRPV